MESVDILHLEESPREQNIPFKISIPSPSFILLRTRKPLTNFTPFSGGVERKKCADP